MGLLASLERRRRAKPRERAAGQDRGFLVYANTSEVIRAESLLKDQGWHIQVKGPPPEIQTGCDLVIEFPLIEELAILRVLEEAGLKPLQVAPVTGPLLEPVDIYQTTDFGDHLMVRAANMKITVDKSSGVIVNVSGGGCPDVPYLAGQLIGRRLSEAPSPRQLGHTLCGYALELAYQELLRQCSR
jgi:hypothetical protein